MTKILLHVDGALSSRISIDPNSIETRNVVEGFPVATAFSAYDDEVPDILFDEGIFTGTLLGDEARLPSPGDKIELAISCGPTVIFDIERSPDGRRLARSANNAFDIDTTPLLEMMSDSQKHFLTRKPRG